MLGEVLNLLKNSIALSEINSLKSFSSNKWLLCLDRDFLDVGKFYSSIFIVGESLCDPRYQLRKCDIGGSEAGGGAKHDVRITEICV